MKPILFSTPMVQAILAGRKTQTRRVVKPQPINFKEEVKLPMPIEDFANHAHLMAQKGYKLLYTRGPLAGLSGPDSRYKTGDILYVRETWRALVNCETGDFHSYDYYADMPEDFHKQYPHKWKPSLFMPKDAARIFLEVTDVRAERLQEISEADAKSEGWGGYSNSIIPGDDPGCIGNGPRTWFRKLWDSINAKKCPWDSNPWVWVYTFNKIEKPHGK